MLPDSSSVPCGSTWRFQPGIAGRTKPRRSNGTTFHQLPGGGELKTLAIRLDDDVHARLSMLAQLEELTVTDAIRQAIASYIETKRNEHDLTARVDAMIADIDRDAASKRDAIVSLVAGDGPSLEVVEPTEAKPSARSRTKRGEATT